MKVFDDFLNTKHHTPQFFSAFSDGGDPSFAEVKNSSSFKKQAPIFWSTKLGIFHDHFKIGLPKTKRKISRSHKKRFLQDAFGMQLRP